MSVPLCKDCANFVRRFPSNLSGCRAFIDPIDGGAGFAFGEVLQFKEPHYDGHMDECEDAQWRTFYLLVAEAL